MQLTVIDTAGNDKYSCQLTIQLSDIYIPLYLL